MKLDHLQLAMPAGEEEKARRFFAGVFGMSEQQKPEPLASRGGCWFRKGSVILHIGVDTPFVPQQKAHPAFIVEDLDSIERALKERGHRVVWDDSLPNRKRFYTEDPFGNRIEILQEGDGFSQK
ncbi:MAG: hypothetical protein MK080_09685 [Opitutales bacterium]|nr:hypothetical protein [Opitutales bacterium]NRA28137.1 glyoxalase [Opitutales bacterium]